MYFFLLGEKERERGGLDEKKCMCEAAPNEAKTVPEGFAAVCKIWLSTNDSLLIQLNPPTLQLSSLISISAMLLLCHPLPLKWWHKCTSRKGNTCSAKFGKRDTRRGEWMTKLGLSDVFVQSSDKLFCPPPPKNRPLCNFSKTYQSLTHLLDIIIKPMINSAVI